MNIVKYHIFQIFFFYTHMFCSSTSLSDLQINVLLLPSQIVAYKRFFAMLKRVKKSIPSLVAAYNRVRLINGILRSILYKYL